MTWPGRPPRTAARSPGSPSGMQPDPGSPTRGGAFLAPDAPAASSGSCASSARVQQPYCAAGSWDVAGCSFGLATLCERRDGPRRPVSPRASATGVPGRQRLGTALLVLSERNGRAGERGGKSGMACTLRASAGFLFGFRAGQSRVRSQRTDGAGALWPASRVMWLTWLPIVTVV
jgi:hypothetical protein